MRHYLEQNNILITNRRVCMTLKRFALCLSATLLFSDAALSQSMTPPESNAEAVWKMRAALNVGALQCQYDPALKVVDNYNQFIKQHKAGLETARTTMEGYYRRRYGKAWAGQFDRYNTKTYNSFSATGVQVAYCNKMGDVGTKALALSADALTPYAVTTVPEIRAIFPQPAPVVKAAAKSKGKKSVKKKSAKKKR
jgi:hypothetical protein